jgi:hypothetical protein
LKRGWSATAGKAAIAEEGASMETAEKILIVGGMLHFAYSSLIGFALSRIRLKGADTGTFLPLAHRVSLWWGFMFLGMPWAVRLSPLSPGVETLAAWLLVASSALSDVEPLLNLWQGVKDPVAERSLALYLGGISVALFTVGLAILIVGVVRGL